MQKNTLQSSWLAVLIFFFCCAGSVAHAQSAGNKNAILSLVRDKFTHLPKSITFSEEANYSIDKTSDVFRQYLELESGSSSLQLVSTQQPSAMITVQRYTQRYQGIPVEHSSCAVTAKNGIIRFITGNIYQPAQLLSAQPVLSETAALDKALHFVGAEKYRWQDAKAEQMIKKRYRKNDTSYYPKASLVWIEDRSSGQRDGKLHLAYRFDVYAQKPLSRDLIYVDATNGKILFRNAMIKHITATGGTLYSGSRSVETELVSPGTYQLHDLTRGNGIFTYTFNNTLNMADEVSNSSTVWPTSQAIDAHWGAEKVYDYWKDVHNRLSYDGFDGELDSYVNYDVNFDNAFWDGSEMIYGDGSGIINGGFSPLVSLDVCAHEIGHGVCENTANLIYFAESGAMNEGFSDIWGAVIENYADPHEQDAQPKETWEIGEEIGATPLRSLADPKAHGQPDTYGGTNWINTVNCNTSTFDNCGVHTNSGVLNHWFYLLVNGGSGTNDLNNAFQVAGIGMNESADIVYNTELVLSSSAEYADCRTASINAAATLFGSCSAEVEAVTRAWYAIGVGTDFTPCTPQISFAAAVTQLSENAATAACPATRTVSIPLKITGPALTGGNAVATVSVVNSGNAINGVDYTLSNTTLTFPAGSSASQNVSLTIFDNGAIDTSRSFVLGYTLAANGSNASMANVLTRDSIVIVNDDSIPQMGGDEVRFVGVGTAATSNFTSPFYGSAKTAHTEYIITASELAAAGIRPNVPIKSLAFNVTQKFSTQPFTNYTINMINTSTPDLSFDFISGGTFTTVYSNNVTTTTGWNTLQLTANFSWDGVSNIGVQICFNNAVVTTNQNDRVAAVSTSSYISAYNGASTGSGACTLPYIGNVSTARPLFRFRQTIPPTPIETTANSSRTWDVRAGQRNYFYSSADEELIARIDSASVDMGCVSAMVKTGGNGFVAALIGTHTVNRSIKEFTLTATGAGATANYNAAFYLNDTELNGTMPTQLLLVKTDATTDADIDATNTQVVTPQLLHGANYAGFKGNFSGAASRFFLVDKDPLSVHNPSLVADGIIVKNNPFHDVIHIAYTYPAADNAVISLYDLSGRLLYRKEQYLAAGSNSFDIDLAGAALSPGHYVLQIAGSRNVFVQKMLHE